MTNTVSTDQIIHCDAHTYGAHTDTQIVPRSSGRPRHVLTASVPLSAPEDTPFLPPPPQRSCNLSPSKLQSCSALCGTAPPTMHGARATCRRQPRTAVELAEVTRQQSTTGTSRMSCEDIMRLPAWHAAAIGELARSMPQLLAIELWQLPAVSTRGQWASLVMRLRSLALRISHNGSRRPTSRKLPSTGCFSRCTAETLLRASKTYLSLRQLSCRPSYLATH